MTTVRFVALLAITAGSLLGCGCNRPTDAVVTPKVAESQRLIQTFGGENGVIRMSSELKGELLTVEFTNLLEEPCDLFIEELAIQLYEPTGEPLPMSLSLPSQGSKTIQLSYPKGASLANDSDVRLRLTAKWPNHWLRLGGDKRAGRLESPVFAWSDEPTRGQLFLSHRVPGRTLQVQITSVRIGDKQMLDKPIELSIPFGTEVQVPESSRYGRYPIIEYKYRLTPNEYWRLGEYG